MSNQLTTVGGSQNSQSSLPSQREQILALVDHSYTRPRGISFRNGECWKELIVAEDLPKIEGLLGPWPYGHEIASAILDKRPRLSPGLFSVQFGGKWFTKLPQGTWPLRYAHISASGGFSVADIICELPFREVRLGGHVPWFPLAMITYLLAWFLTVFSASISSLSDSFTQTAIGMDDAAAFTMRTKLPWLGDPRSYSPSRSHGCLFKFLSECALPADVLFLHGITVLTTRLSMQQAAWLEDISNGYLSGYLSTNIKTGLGHISSTPFPHSRFVRMRVRQLIYMNLGAETLTPSSSVSAPVIQALGGVRQVITSLINGRRASELGSPWNWTLWPTDMLRLAPRWAMSANQRDIYSIRTSEYMRFFPEDTERLHLPQRFSEDLRSIFAFQATEAAPLANTLLPAQYSRSYIPVTLSRALRTKYAALAPILEGRTDNDVFRAAQDILAQQRFMGANGKRIFQDWDAMETTRNRQLFELGTRAQVREYRELCFRLWSNYLVALQSEDFLRTLPGGTTAVPNTAANVMITHMNAHYIPANPNANPPIPALNPEAPFWQDLSQEELVEGYKQFFDVSAMSREQIAVVVGCLAPLAIDQLPRVRFGQPGHERTYWFGNARHTFPNGVNEIFLHYGTGNIPTPADQQWIANHAHDFPSSALLASVIRIVAAKLDIGDQFNSMLDLALHKGVVYRNQDIYNRADNAPNQHGLIYADGDHALFFPRNKSIDGYFAPFFEPGLLMATANETLSPTRRHDIIHVQALISHARAVSLNWAGKAVSILGQHWSAIAAPQGAAAWNMWIRNRIDAWIHDYYNSYSNAWSEMHHNACATQFGFSISMEASLHESGLVQAQWPAWQSPYLANHYLELWMMKMIPTFQVYPYYDKEGKTSRLISSDDYGTAVPSLPTFNASRELKVSRELQAIPGRNYFGDGGVEYNGQFLAAQGGGVGNPNTWRFERANNDWRVMDPCWSEMPYAYQLGQTWNRVRTVYAGAPGTNFADFALPGSLRTFQEINNKLLSWGFRQSTDLQNMLTAEQISRIHKIGCGHAHQSLMVNYINPYAVHTQTEQLADYSIVILSSGSKFAGMALQPGLETLVSPDDRLNRERPQQSPFTHHGADDRKGRDTAPVRVAGSKTHTARVSPTPIRGKYSFDSKYPVWRDQLPTIPSIKVEVENDTIRALPTGSPDSDESVSETSSEHSYDDVTHEHEYDQTTSDDTLGRPNNLLSDEEIAKLLHKADTLGRVDTKALEFYRTRAAKTVESAIDAEFQQTLQELQQRAAARQTAQATPKSLRERIAFVKKHDQLPPRRTSYSLSQSNMKGKSVRPSRQPPKKVTFEAQASGALPTEPVTINDAAAEQAQRAAEEHRENLKRLFAEKTPLVKLPKSPTLEEIKANAKDNGFGSLTPTSPSVHDTQAGDGVPIPYSDVFDDRDGQIAGPADFSRAVHAKLGQGGVPSRDRVQLPEN